MPAYIQEATRSTLSASTEPGKFKGLASLFSLLPHMNSRLLTHFGFLEADYLLLGFPLNSLWQV